MRDIILRPILYISEPYSPGENSTTQQNIQVARDHAVKAWERGDAYDRNQNHTRTHRNA